MEKTGAIFITFSGNCKEALTFYRNCFGGQLQFQTFEKELGTYKELPVVTGSLISERVTIYGSDLVHNEGRKLGNYMAIFLQCQNARDRKQLMEQLDFNNKPIFSGQLDRQQLIELTDPFDVRWVLGV
ncbi:glyoxalase [Pedobacter insulae]|uniref:PhnB protein n=1 Tax=Pedobacter insulae TaxID=414048 RepID=A0A1I2YD62_9SPHI|nr:glyoxalase [Pedobacter insulae]SFH23650.1 hypothetical protein SAMN04489864_10725 [Pedobacter insulae]